MFSGILSDIGPPKIQSLNRNFGRNRSGDF